MNVAVELLETLRKTESSLKRIRQGRAGDAAAAGGPSDIDKISLQHFLDVQVMAKPKFLCLALILPIAMLTPPQLLSLVIRMLGMCYCNNIAWTECQGRLKCTVR